MSIRHTSVPSCSGKPIRIIVRSHAQLELLASIAAFEADRHQYQRRMTDIGGILRIDPFQGAERQEQDIDALFLFQSARIVIEFEQPLLQSLGREARLKARIAVPCADATLVGLVILGLGICATRVTCYLALGGGE